MSMSRRAFLAAIPAVTVAGCSGQAPLRVAVVWSGEELRRFLRVVDAYAARQRRPVSVYSAGDNISALLRGPAEDVIPDVAVIPRLGLLFDPVVRPRIRPRSGGHEQPEFWRRLVTPYDSEEELGAWFKIANKSLVWHRAGEQWSPASLTHWQPGPGSLAIGAADGWVLSDWFENVLLAYAPEVYTGLYPPAERGSQAWWGVARVTEALTLLATIWREAFTQEQGRRALTMQFHDSILDVFSYRTADVVAAPDFALPVIERYGGGDVARHFPFPGLDGGDAPLVVGGDVAVAMRGGGQDALDFVNWLTRPRASGERDALTDWVDEGGFLTPYSAPSHPLLRMPAQMLDKAESRHYDLSDRLIGRLEGGDGRGLWRVLTELFTDVTAGTVAPATAAAAAREKIVEAAAA
ncbi:ABC transporter substrate-binding protein [Nonomuraea monospora]|uniref:ABC transporter substrate-binding protein n=1 Tax=Nonomuraea monospora TaxID=568818 RepID=A0ABN3D0B5_9ACTN